MTPLGNDRRSLDERHLPGWTAGVDQQAPVHFVDGGTGGKWLANGA
jgi:hypothetical protein